MQSPDVEGHDLGGTDEEQNLGRGETFRPVLAGALIGGLAVGLGQPGVVDGIDDGAFTPLGIRVSLALLPFAGLVWLAAGRRARGALLGLVPVLVVVAAVAVSPTATGLHGAVFVACLAPTFAAMTDRARPITRRLSTLMASTVIASITVLGGASALFITSVLLRLDQLDGLAHGLAYGVAFAIALLFVAGSVAISTHFSIGADHADDAVRRDPVAV